MRACWEGVGAAFFRPPREETSRYRAGAADRLQIGAQRPGILPRRRTELEPVEALRPDRDRLDAFGHRRQIGVVAHRALPGEFGLAGCGVDAQLDGLSPHDLGPRIDGWPDHRLRQRWR